MKRGSVAGLFEFTEGVEEIYDVRLIPKIRQSNLLTLHHPCFPFALADQGAAPKDSFYLQNPGGMHWLKRPLKQQIPYWQSQLS